MTITEFLLARVIEDELRANLATYGPWRYDSSKFNALDHEESVFTGPSGASAVCVASTGPSGDLGAMADAEHIARHDPARVLAECAAKRRIVEAHPLTSDVTPVHTGPTPGVGCLTCASLGRSEGDIVEDLGPCDTLLAVASVYADHPDYDTAWDA